MKRLRWPKADGTISWSKVADWYDIDGDIMYSTQIEYKYVVDGVEYTGNRLNVSRPQTSSPDRHERIVARYPKGAAVRVAYDPEKPFDSVLEPGAPIGAYLPLILGVVMTALAGGMLYQLADVGVDGGNVVINVLLETERLILRRFTALDADIFSRWTTTPV